MKRFLSLMLCAAMLLGLLPGGIVLRAAAAESGYVTDNLVLYLDANNNTGSGYDAAADTWKNLAAGGEEIALNGSVWGTDATYGTHYLSVGSYIILPDSVRQALAGGAFTVEFVMDDYEGTTKDGDNIRNIMALTGSDRWIAASVDKVGTPNDKFVIYQNKGELTVNFKVNDGVDAWNTRTNVPASSINGATQTIAFQTGENAKWYQGGALKNTSGVTYPDAPGVSTFSGAQSGEVPQVIFGAAEDRVAERAFSGKVRAIRVYKDVLTDSEIAANARHDVKRHYTKAEESVVPAGYVTDDLVLYLDANNNTGSGYDSTSTVWANLVAPDQTVAVNGQVWGSDREHGSHYLAFDDNYILLPDEVRRALAGERFTIEFVMDDFTIENNGSICNVMCVTGDDAYIKEFKDGDRTKTEATPNDSFVIFAARNGSDDVKFRTCYGTTGWASITEEGKYANVKAGKMSGVTNALLFDNAEGQKWYLDGDLEATKEIAVEGKTINLNGFKVGSTWTSDRTCQIAFGAATDVIANRYFNGNVKAIRIYRDALTEAEIAQNAAADQLRYYTDYVPAAVIPEGYETDGLVLFLDANSNTGKTFDSAAATWVDLSDESGSTVVDLNGHTWGSNEDYANSNYLSINNGYIKLPEKVRQAIAGGEFTVEFLIDDYAGNPTNATSSIANIMALTGSDRWIEAKTTPGGTPNDNFVVFQHIGDNKVQLKINSYYNRASVSAATIDGTTQALTFKADGKPSWHQNGTVRSTAGEDYVAPDVASFSGAQAGEVPQVIFGAATDTVADRTFVAKVQAIRVYDRVLSADELKGNADADKARYRSGSFKEAAAEAWSNVIGTLGELGQTVTLAQLKTYAEDKLDSAGLVDVSVTAAGNGAYEFTYCKKGTTEKIVTHTLYVDVPYQVDTDRLTAEQKEAFLADVVGYGGNEKNQVTINWDNADNALYYKGTRAGDPVSHLYFPVYTTANNYVYEAEVGFDSYGSWSCMAFGASEVLEHYQYAFYGSFGKESTGGAAEFVRFQDPAENGGTFATGHDNISGIKLGELMGDGTNGTIDASLYDTGHATQYQVKDTVKYKVIVHDGVLYGFIDDVQVLTTVAAGTIYKKFFGGFGFNTATSALNIHSVSIRPITAENEEEELAGVVKEFNPRFSFEPDLYEPDTDIKTAPIVMQTADSGTTHLSGAAKRPSALIFDVKLDGGVLCAYDGTTKLGTFKEVFKANCDKVNVGARIALGDLDSADALNAILKDENNGNIWVISNDVEVLERVTNVITTARGVVDFTGDTVRGPGNVSYTFADTNNNGSAYDDFAKLNFEYVTYTGGYTAMTWSEIYDALFSCNYRTALLPESVINKDYVHYLQGSMVNVIVETEADSEIEFYDLIACGVNGILSSDYETNIATLESGIFDADGESILVRGGTVVAHRGDMGNEYLYPENSVESIVTGGQSGASAVEFDVYMTLDKQLVLMHNNNIKGYFVYRDDCPLPESERIADTVHITNRYWEGDLEYLRSTYNPEIPMQRLEDLLAVVDTEYPDLRLHFDIKDARIECLNHIVAATHEYGVRNRSEMMFFDKSGLEYTNSLGFSGTYLSPVAFFDSDERVYSAEMIYRPLNSTWHSQWQWIDTDYLEELKHFGQTAYPWATYKPEVMDAYYVQGYQGFTTDIPHWTDDYIRSITPEYDQQTGKVTVTARTLAHHQTGTFDESSITVQKWWLEQGVSGATEYQLPYDAAADNNFEVIVLTGAENVTVSGDTVTVNENATGDAVIAVRYRQQLTGESDFYIYSNTITVGTGKITGYDVAANESVTYDGNAHASATVTVGIPADAVITFVCGEEEYDEVPSFTDVGTYEVSYTISKAGYNDETGSYTFKIEKGDIAGFEIKANDTAKYDGNAHASATVTVGIPADAVIAFVCGEEEYDEVPSFTDVGTYEVSYTISKAGYNDVTGSYSFTIESITFADIPEDSWQYQFAAYAVANGLMAGKGTDADGHIIFDPNSPIKREEFVQVLYNAEGKPAISIANPFPDVADGGWYKNAVLWAKQNDIASGKGNGNFGVGENISRQDLAMMLYKYAKLNGYSLDATEGLINQFADGANVASYAKTAMDWAVTNGIMSGKGAAGAPLSSFRLDPTGIATRAECAAMLKNFQTAFGG